MKISSFEMFLVLLSVLIAVFHVISFGFCLQDDTFIGLRYSRNLALGNGLVYNAGERVEGYTNFSWVVISAIPFLLGTDPILFARVLSIASAAFAVLMVGGLANVLSKGAGGAAFAGSFLFACFPFAMAEAAMGLETLLFTALIVASLLRFLLERQNQQLSGYGSGVLLALGALTRPEALGIAVILAAADMINIRKSEKGSIPRMQARNRWLCFALPVLLHSGFRWLYYGDIVPNTFHAKVGGGANAVRRGLLYSAQFARDAAPLLVATVLCLISAKFKRLGLHEGLGTCIILLLFYIAYVICVGGDFKPTHRFYVLPSALMAAVIGAVLISRLKNTDRIPPPGHILY